ncbi:MAG: hypothetical protein PWP65_1757 [Clostridia bacterium]|nr:hypothetical protein [Clostridia bacterium]
MRAGLFLKAVVLLFLLLPLAGCWSRREIDALAIVGAMGLDDVPGSEDLRLSVLVVKPREVGGGPTMGGRGGGGGAPTRAPAEIFSATGADINEAIRRLETQVPRVLFWGHSRALILGEGFARRGLNWLDWLSRDREVRENIPLFITSGEARRVLELPPEVEVLPGITLIGILRNKVALRVDLKDVLVMLQCRGDAPVLPRIELLDKEEKSGSPGGGGRGGQEAAGSVSGGSGETGPAGIRLNGSGVFKEGRLAGWMTNDETLGLMWLRNEVKAGAVTIPCPRHRREQLSFRIRRSRTEIKPEIKGGKITFQVKIRTEGDLAEETCSEVYDTPRKLAMLEGLFAGEIRGRVEKALARARQLKVDCFGLGAALYRVYPKYFLQVAERWDEEFTRAEVKVQVKVDLRRTGMNVYPIQSQKVLERSATKKPSSGAR